MNIVVRISPKFSCSVLFFFSRLIIIDLYDFFVCFPGASVLDSFLAIIKLMDGTCLLNISIQQNRKRVFSDEYIKHYQKLTEIKSIDL